MRLVRNATAVALVLYCLLAGFASHAASAQELCGVITVIDADGNPVRAAGIEVAGTQRVLAHTNTDGRVKVCVEPQTRLLARSGDFVSDAVLAAPVMHLSLHLEVIARVSSHPGPGTLRTSESSPSSIVAGNVGRALGYVPGYRDIAEGGPGGLSLNGVPLNLPAAPPGTAAAGGGFPSDLVSSFDAVQADDGSIQPDYHLLSPTPAFRWNTQIGADTFGGSDWKSTIAGPSGKLRYALAVAGGGDGGVLAGMTFADASGIAYDHGSQSHHVDGSLVLDDSIGNVNVAFVGAGSRQAAAYIVDLKPGPIVQGFGPGNIASQDFGTEYLLATTSRGRDSFSAIDVRYNGGAVDDLSNAILAGRPVPSNSGYRYFGSSDSLAWTRAFGPASLSLSVDTKSNTSTGFANDFTGVERSGKQDVKASYKFMRGQNGYGATLGADHLEGPFGGEALESTVFVSKRIGSINGRLSLSSSQAQSELATYATTYSLQPVETATLTCSPATASVAGASQTGTTHPRANDAILSLSQSAPTTTLHAGAFISDISNALVQATVPDVLLPPDYLSSLDRFFATLCPTHSLPVSDVFVQRYETVPVLRQQEWYIDDTRKLGNVSIELSYETFSDTAALLSSERGGVGTLVPGAQLPNVPLHRASVIVAVTHGKTIVALAARFVSANNAENLPGHLTVDSGVQFPIGFGRIEASAQNIFAAYSGRFTSPLYAVWIPTTRFALPTLATPLQTTWSLRYVATIGARP
jgi:hypothetical protein